MMVRFDYNNKTFVPTEEPVVVKLGQINGSQAGAIRQEFDQYAQQRRSEQQFLVPALVPLDGVRGMISLIPIMGEEPDSSLTKLKWGEKLVLFKEAKLASSKFGTIRLHPTFKPFLINALRIESNKSLHKTHAVIVDMTMGFRLVEIKSLDEFRVVATSEALQIFRQNPNIPAQVVDSFATNYLDLESSPMLLASRKMYPRNALLVIFFCCKRTGVVFVLPSLSEIYPDHDVHLPKKCDKKASEAFSKLRRVSLPNVELPRLH
eukprot:scaffold4510_cov183-Amphora_coffeaeformis.AAC.56